MPWRIHASSERGLVTSTSPASARSRLTVISRLDMAAERKCGGTEKRSIRKTRGACHKTRIIKYTRGQKNEHNNNNNNNIRQTFFCFALCFCVWKKNKTKKKKKKKTKKKKKKTKKKKKKTQSVISWSTKQNRVERVAAAHRVRCVCCSYIHASVYLSFFFWFF